MIEVKNLTYQYPGSDVPALKNLNIKFPREKVFALLGESGSGKTTFLNCIARFIKPTSGGIYIEGKNISEMTESELRRSLGVVFQKLNLFPHMTVLRNLTLAPEKAFGKDVKEAQQSAFEMLDRLGIKDLADRYPAQISGGQAQRVAIARGLMLEPQYMLLDEPTSALDAKTTGDFTEWLRELQTDTSFIIVTHDLPFAENIASHGIFIENGEVKSQGDVSEIVRDIESAISG